MIKIICMHCGQRILVNMVNGLNSGVSVICLAWWFRWMRLVTDVLTTVQPVAPTVFLKTNPHPDDHVKHITNTSESDQECVQFFTRYIKSGRLAMVRLPWIPSICREYILYSRFLTHPHELSVDSLFNCKMVFETRKQSMACRWNTVYKYLSTPMRHFR